MRFSAHLPNDADGDYYRKAVAVIGRRFIVPGSVLAEEWDTSTGRGTSFVPRKIAPTDTPRTGILKDVWRQRDPFGTRDRLVLTFDDPASHYAPIGAILSVIGDTVVSDPDDVSALLNFVAGKPLFTEQYPSAANAIAGWLRGLFPDLADVAACPKYDTEEQYRAWVDGVGAVLGTHRSVPHPPVPVDVAPSLYEQMATGSLDETL